MSDLANPPYASSIAELSSAIEKGGISPVELVQASLDRADAMNPAYNAFIVIARDRAMRFAKAAEERALVGARLSAIDGLPVGVKDMIDVRGLTTTNGSGPGWHSQPARSAPVVEALERLGAVVIGKTVPHELGVGIDNNNPHYGPTRNPWDRERSPGGSSGGSAVAVALGIAPGAIGTDTGGSVRIPAALCGVFGLKPSFGSLPTEGVTPIAWSLDHVGPLAARADDLDVLYRSMTIGRPLPADRRGRVGLKGLRIGVPTTYFSERIMPAVADAYARALNALEAEGCTVQEVDLPANNGVVEDAFTLAQVEGAYAHRDHIPQRLGELGDDACAFLKIGDQVPALRYVDALKRQARFRGAVDESLAAVDVLVVPTTPAVAQPIGTSELEFGDSKEPLFNCMIRYTSVFNVSGHPALAVPCPVGADGLPAGIQIVGPMGSDSRLLGIGSLYDELVLADHRARLASVREATRSANSVT